MHANNPTGAGATAPRTRRRRFLGAATALALVTSLVAVAAMTTTGTAAAAGNDKVLKKYAAATWKSFEAMAHPDDRPARRQHRSQPAGQHTQRVHLSHQHRLLHVEHGGRP